MGNENVVIIALDKLFNGDFMRTKKGLFLAIVLIGSSLSWVFAPLVNRGYLVAIVLLMDGFYFLLWYYLSGRMFFNPKKIKVFFAVDPGEDSRRYYDQIFKSIQLQIDQLELSDKLDIKRLPEDFSFSKRSAAEQFIKRKMVDLLIWGYVLGEKTGQESLTAEFNLQFTYLYQVASSNVSNVLIKNIDLSLRDKYWTIAGKTERSLQDIKVIASNITEVSLFIIGMSLYTRGKLEKSIDIFEKILYIIKDKNEQNFPNVKMFREQISQHLLEAYKFMGDMLREDAPSKSKGYYEKALKIEPDNSAVHLCMAKLSYVVDGDLNAAIDHTNRVVDPFFKPLASYNYAFFAIKKHDEKEVLRHYKSTRNTPDANILLVLDFLEKEFAKDRENIMFRFALGYINIYHADSKIGLEELESFVNLAERKSLYPELVSNAKALIAHRK